MGHVTLEHTATSYSSPVKLPGHWCPGTQWLCPGWGAQMSLWGIQPAAKLSTCPRETQRHTGHWHKATQSPIKRTHITQAQTHPLLLGDRQKQESLAQSHRLTHQVPKLVCSSPGSSTAPRSLLRPQTPDSPHSLPAGPAWGSHTHRALTLIPQALLDTLAQPPCLLNRPKVCFFLLSLYLFCQTYVSLYVLFSVFPFTLVSQQTRFLIW